MHNTDTIHNTDRNGVNKQNTHTHTHTHTYTHTKDLEKDNTGKGYLV